MPIQSLIDKYLVCGSVWRALQTFSGGEPAKIKLLVILRRERTMVSYLMPTSKGDYYRKTHGSAFVFVPKGSCSFFPQDTYIGCDGIYVDSYDRFADLFKKKRITYIGQLTDVIVDEIEQALKGSRVLSPLEKRRLFPEIVDGK